MAYSSQTDLINAVGRQMVEDLSDDDGAGALDARRVDAAIASADTVIDSYLRDRYSVPVSPTPDVLREISTDLAIVNLHKRRFPDLLSEAMTDRRDQAMALLKRLADGTAALPGATATIDPTPATVRTNARTRLFDTNTLAGY